MALSADEIKELLSFRPHPTCGFVAVTYRIADTVAPEALPPGFDGPRVLGFVLYFLVTADAHIAMHRILSDQMYHHHAGDPLEVLLLHADGGGDIRTVGPDLARGERPQLFIPGRTFHMSRLKPERGYALLGTTEWPGVEAPDNIETGNREALVAAYPAMADAICAFIDGVPATVLPRAAG